MKAATTRLALQAAALAFLIPAASYAGNLEDKLSYCKSCHGAHGQGFAGYYTVPRLAGQQVQYIENAFKGLAEHTRDNPLAKRFMVPAEGSIEPSMRTVLAEHFSKLDPKPAGDGPADLVAAGKRIYEEGIPSGSVPACVGCHGADAKGAGAIPRLAGQHFAYLAQQLMGWQKGYRSKDPGSPSDANVMAAIAAGLNKEQMSAVAAYLSFQR
jgi:cytochrome c553